MIKYKYIIQKNAAYDKTRGKKMKKAINEVSATILAVAVILSVTACGVQQTAVTGNSTGQSVISADESTAQSNATGTTVSATTTAAATAITNATKAETTVKKETTAVTTVVSTPATTAEPTWKETKKSAEMYLNTSVYSRTKAYIGAPTADLYQINDKVKVVAVTDTDYYKLDNGKFIHSDYLSEEKTEIQTMTTMAVTTATTAPPATTAPAVSTAKTDKKAAVKGKYISSGYEPLDDIIFPLLDKLVNDSMSDDDKRLAIYDYLVQFQYQERTLLIPKNKKQYEEQLEAISLFEKGYGLCYDFSAAFKYMTKAIGMNTVMYYGSHKSRNSGYTLHSWTMLEIDGTLYFFDPSMERIMINDGMGEGQHYRYRKPYYWFYDYYVTDYTTS